MEDDTDELDALPNRGYEATTVFSHGEGNPWARRHALRFLNQLGTVIYAVRLADGLIKIGYTTDLYTRMSHMAGLNCAQLIAFRFGDLDDERAIHQSLNVHVAQGREYYYPTEEVLAVVCQWHSAPPA